MLKYLDAASQVAFILMGSGALLLAWKQPYRMPRYQRFVVAAAGAFSLVIGSVRLIRLIL